MPGVPEPCGRTLTLAEVPIGKVQEDHTSRGSGAGSLIVGGAVHIQRDREGERAWRDLTTWVTTAKASSLKKCMLAQHGTGTSAGDSHSG